MVQLHTANAQHMFAPRHAVPLRSQGLRFTHRHPTILPSRHLSAPCLAFDTIRCRVPCARFLWQNQLESLPADLGLLVNLELLYLHQNRLTRLPAELGQLVNLRRLALGGNRLASLPAELGQLVRLEHLILSQNCLSSLPAELTRLTRLQKLNLDYNPMSELPAAVEALRAAGTDVTWGAAQSDSSGSSDDGGDDDDDSWRRASWISPPGRADSEL